MTVNKTNMQNPNTILISENPKNPYRKPLTIYKIGFSLDTVCQKGGNKEIE